MTGSNSAEKAYKDFRAPIAIGALILLALYFWLTSRYPALNEKAIMGGDSPLSGLSFEIVYEILPNSDLWWEIVANTANWIKTNLKGMTFGVLFGAAALTVLGTIKKRSFKNGFANSALGAAIGAPLGVCVNCAAPIALGLHMGRMRLETTLSALFASPTLNVIVITMSFALLPPHMAILKLIFALVLVLLVVPLMCQYILQREAAETGSDLGAAMPKLAKVSESKGLSGWFARMLSPAEFEPGSYGPATAFVWFVKTYARNLFVIGIITVPLMFLAALLGAAVASTVSPTELTKLLPGQDLVMIVLATIAIVAIASFVPAPIAFDVILTVILINVGMQSHFALAGLIALGSFSVYTFLILGKAISWRTAFSLWGAVMSIACFAGFVEFIIGPQVDKYYEQRQLQALNSVEKIEWPTPPAAPEAVSMEQLRTQLQQVTLAAAPVKASISTSANSQISIQRVGTAPTTAAIKSVSAPFARIQGTEIGIGEVGVSSPIREFGYYMVRGGIAAGDIHGDGWVDLVTRRPDHANGLSIYANVGGTFVRQNAELGPVDGHDVFNVALADVDGDAALDLFVSTIMGGSYVFFNENGSFSSESMAALKEGGNDVVASYGFADMDRDGDLDIVLGNWGPRGIAEGWALRPLHLRNQIFVNTGDRTFEPQSFEGIPGPTLSILLSDVNGDGYQDLIKGDDAGASDEVVFFGAEGPRPSTPDSQPFEYFIRSTMSYDEGDWNNDLLPDYYGGQISMRTGMASSSLSRTRNVRAVCQQYGEDFGWSDDEVNSCFDEQLSIERIRDGRSGKSGDSCRSPSNIRDQALCGAASQFPKYENARRNPDGDPARFEACHRVLKHIPLVAQHCNSLSEPTIGLFKSKEMGQYFRPALSSGNILQTGAEDGSFADLGVEAGVRSPGWTWNARFADLDQDGWQDILVMTGIWLNVASTHTNVFYHNSGDGFKDGTESFGFTDLLPSYSHVSFDFDRDGDIDVIRDNSGLRMIVHRNDKPAGPALWVNLRDRRGNSMGIGARVTICVDGQAAVAPGKCQMRSIKASGGYASTEPIAAHFGLGGAENVSLIEVRWPDGEVTELKPEALLGGEITISRG